ncbi:MAG: hypothetical protein IT204_11355 [Fimbriimonadaceae bacterium]|nr:hypothetical protein [Fimbriimonadaceae bacterium]
MRYLVLAWFGGLWAVGCPAAAVYLERFENGVAGWQSVPEGGDLTVQREVAKEGSALQYSYQLAGEPPIVVGPVSSPPLNARSLRLQLRTSARAALAVALNEQDGSSWVSIVQSRANVWQALDIGLDRLQLSKDSRDENGKLDIAQVAHLVVIDATGLVGLLGDQTADAVRTRSLWLDDVSLETAESPTQYSATGKLPFLLDNFETDLLSWFALNGEVEPDPAKGRLLWTYTGGKPKPGQITAILGTVGPLPATGATHLVLTLQSERAMKLIVVLQEQARDGRDESRYLMLVDVPFQRTAQSLALDLTEFKLETDNGGKDENGKLDLDQIETLILADLEALAGQEPGLNSVSIEELEVIGVQ